VGGKLYSQDKNNIITIRRTLTKIISATSHTSNINNHNANDSYCTITKITIEAQAVV
jgi:hypothetical protein